MTSTTTSIKKLAENNDLFKLKQIFELLIVLLTLAYKWSISLNTYSGKGKPPMFGDYEAQRHWMEITYNLNVKTWYTNTTDNDLNYWGLDYPPLTAYHSHLMGYIANKIDPMFVALFASRGIESYEHKLFMRMTVFLADIIIFYPSVFLVLSKLFNSIKSTTISSNVNSLTWLDSDYLITLLLVLLNPTLALIDHGHFQYNCASLGLMQLAFYFILKTSSSNTKAKSKEEKLSNDVDSYLRVRWLVLASIFFCLALNYKQMELYHALPFFFYLLGICFKSRTYINCFTRLVCIGLSVLFTFAILWWPFISGGLDLTLQVLNRLFPFSRGLFEDKVANFWCSLSVLVKIKDMFAINQLSRASLILTAVSHMPMCIDLLIRPTRQRFVLAIINSSILFYLFSFQVHEKSILLATVPACLLINYYPMIVSWFILIANFSMLPLFYKDGLTMPFISTSLMFLLIVLFYYKLNESKRNLSFVPSFNSLFRLVLKSNETCEKLNSLTRGLFKLVYFLSLVGIVALTICLVSLDAPKRLPDLWTVLVSFYACLHFIAFSVLFHLIQFTLSDNDLRISEMKRIEINSKSPLSTSHLIFTFNSKLSQILLVNKDDNKKRD